MTFWNEFTGYNAGYVLDLYQRFLDDPAAVDAGTRRAFENWTPPDSDQELPEVGASSAPAGKLMAVVQLAQAIRAFGHLAAQLDPLGSPPRGDRALDAAFYGLEEADLRDLPARLAGKSLAETHQTAGEAIAALRAVYCGASGYDFDHVRAPAERQWLCETVESGRLRPPQDPIAPAELLRRLTQIEVFETFLQRMFPGKTRFSIEGLDMLAPMLDELLGAAAEDGVCTILLGMAHRGRLNVLAHVLAMPYERILSKFKDPLRRSNHELGWTGDVKYHAGARHAIGGGQMIELVVAMPPNPSHLESIDPVVQGMARAAQSVITQRGEPALFPQACLPVLVHGDASFPGQGVAAETLNLGRLAGYQTGGTIHIIANNQLGFTATASESRSTLYASDLAKGFNIPIVHVNADDPPACIESARLAFEYRQRFQRDFMIDLVGYRRHGHNEGDEPRFTQPQLYQEIDQHPSVRALWAQRLVDDGVIEPHWPAQLIDDATDQLRSVYEALEPEETLGLEPRLQAPEPRSARRVKTDSSVERLQRLNERLLTLPDGFQLDGKLERARARRRQALADADERAVDWATAEELALATILEDSIAVRMTGQDVARGTFSQRHAALHDPQTGQTWLPLQSLDHGQAAFELHNSPLSEYAALGFEYGYNIQAPERLVIWEAQYGDFINNAQTVVDEFIASGRAKWEHTPSLVLLLPHGYEGQGPDHSNAYPQRFLQLAADTNMRIANCTTAAQYFHLLRRQAQLLKVDPLPLVLFTPKSLLRHPAVASTLRELAEGRWQPLIEDLLAGQARATVRRLLFGSGKVCVDLAASRLRETASNTAIVRLEQLYPFPFEDLRPLLDSYSGLDEVVWIQEEPENMGAWEFVRPRLEKLIGGRWPLRYLGRPRSASAAEGSLAWHKVNQEALIELAFQFESTAPHEEEVWIEQG